MRIACRSVKSNVAAAEILQTNYCTANKKIRIAKRLRRGRRSLLFAAASRRNGRAASNFIAAMADALLEAGYLDIERV